MLLLSCSDHLTPDLLHGSSQRAISHYETVAEFPPAQVIVQLAKALNVSADQLLGAKHLKTKNDSPEIQRLWKKFQGVLVLPEKDRRAIMRMINSLVSMQQKQS